MSIPKFKIGVTTITFLFCVALVFRQLLDILLFQQYNDIAARVPEVRYEETRTQIKSSICELLDNRSPMSLWAQNIENILRASKSPMDPHYDLHDPTAQVLKIITPRLQLGLKSAPRDWQALENVIETVNRRIAFLKAKQKGTAAEEEARPLKILVMGGSVTMGIGCKTGIKGYNNEQCCWVTRLETLLNNLLGERVVDIHLAAVGGTNSAIGQIILEYNLLPEDKREADIIINAYSTNDMHIFTMREAMNENITLREKVFEMAQNFTRTALQQCTEEGYTPLFFRLDDYLGNEQRQILATSEFIQGVQVLASYYGFGVLSYADTVRDLVYGSTTERSFSPAGWYQKGAEMIHEIHPPYPMHIAVSYIIAYAFLELASNYCGLESWKVTSWENKMDYYDAIVLGFPDKRGKGSLDTPPQPRPNGLPPPLTSSLDLENVTRLWREAPPVTCDATKQNRIRCPIGWVSGFRLDLTPNNTMQYFQPYIMDPFEWEWKKDNRKFGWLPKHASGATMTFDFPLQQKIRRLVLFYMKSYGEKWDNSKAEIKVYVDGDVTNHPFEFSLTGFHDKRTSEVYTEEFQLPREASKRLQLSVKHTGGQTFKLMGFAICS